MSWLRHWAHRFVLLALIAVLVMGLAYTFPADVALLFALDLSVYVEAVVTVFVVAQVARIRPMITMTRQWLIAAYGRVLGRTASRTGLSIRRDKSGSDNEDEDGAFGFALAA